MYRHSVHKTRPSEQPRVKFVIEVNGEGALPVGLDESIDNGIANTVKLFYDSLAPMMQTRAMNAERGRSARGEAWQGFSSRGCSCELKMALYVSRRVPKIELDEALQAVVFEFLQDWLQVFFALDEYDDRQAGRLAGRIEAATHGRSLKPTELAAIAERLAPTAA